MINSKWKEVKKNNNKYTSYTRVNNKVLKTAHLKTFSNENKMRISIYKKYLTNKKVLDFGCGWADFLISLSKLNKYNYGVDHRIHVLNKKIKNVKIMNDISDFKIKFDTITMFHVLEHIPKPTETLTKLKEKIKKGGSIIIEVPSANDILLKFSIKEFYKFTFWSEHLILYNEEVLKKLLKFCGFKNLKFIYSQRYNFDNHLHWLIEKKPGGHEIFKNFSNKNLKHQYEKFLIKNKLTDTITVIAKV